MPDTFKRVYRPTFGDVGLHWSGQGQEMAWSHQDGSRLNQVNFWRLALYLRFVVEPQVISTCSQLKSCESLVPKMQAAALVTTSKFLIDYAMRPLGSGGPYQVHGNYEWDLMQNLFLKPMQQALIHSKYPEEDAVWLQGNTNWRQLLNLSVNSTGKIQIGDTAYVMVPHEEDPDTSDLLAGMVIAKDKKYPDEPLDRVLCNLVEATENAHMEHAQAILSRRSVDEIAKLGAQIGITQRQLEDFAPTPRLLMLFSLIFTGGIHPAHTQDYADACTLATIRTHDAWHDALGCHTNQAPDGLGVLIAILDHSRAHYLRSTPPGSQLRSLCAKAREPQHAVQCPINNIP